MSDDEEYSSEEEESEEEAAPAPVKAAAPVNDGKKTAADVSIANLILLYVTVIFYFV